MQNLLASIFLHHICQLQNIQKYTISSMEYHLDQLKKHCRICGGRLNKAKGRVQRVHFCAEHSTALQTFVGIPRAEEESTVSGVFCNPCFLKLQRVDKASLDVVPSNSLVALEWEPHQEDCKVRNNKVTHFFAYFTSGLKV